MYPIEQFFQERGGRFTQDDLRFLASYGLQRLIEDSLDDEHGDDDLFEPADEEPEPEPEVGKEIQAEKSRVAGHTIKILGRQMPDEIINALSYATSIFSRRANARIMLLNPWVGEELVAIKTGLFVNPKTDAQVFVCGEFEGNAEDWTRDVIDECGPRTVRDMFVENANSLGLPSLKLIQNDPVQVAAEIDHQELLFLVCPPLRTRETLMAWLPHMRPDGVVAGWHDSGAAASVLRDVGMQLREENGFWSFSVSQYRKAIGKLNSPPV